MEKYYPPPPPHYTILASNVLQNLSLGSLTPIPSIAYQQHDLLYVRDLADLSVYSVVLDETVNILFLPSLPYLLPF